MLDFDDEVMQKAKRMGWTVRDISDPNVVYNNAWRHWESVMPDGDVLDKHFTEREAWERIYFYTIDNVEE